MQGFGLSNVIFASGIDTLPLLPASVIGGEENSLQTYTEGSDTGWSDLPPVEGFLAATTVEEGDQENNGSQSVSVLDGEMAGIPTAHFVAPAPSCWLASGTPCNLPLWGHPPQQTVQCPWAGCFDTLQFMNVPRHIQSGHLGIRFKCFKCGKPYTRPEGLARHTASLKCHRTAHARK